MPKLDATKMDVQSMLDTDTEILERNILKAMDFERRKRFPHRYTEIQLVIDKTRERIANYKKILSQQ